MLIVGLIEPRARVLYVDAAPTAAEVDGLQTLGCVVTTVTGVPGPVGDSPAGDRVVEGALASPGVRDALGPARFDVAVLPLSSTGRGQTLGTQVRQVLPFLSETGYVLVSALGAVPEDRERLEHELLEAGCVVGHVGIYQSTTEDEPGLVVMAFPLPALDIVAFRERAQRLERRAAGAEQQARRLGLQLRQSEADLEVATRQVNRLNQERAALREQVTALEQVGVQADTAATRLQRANSELASREAEVRRAQVEANHAHAEAEALRASLAEAGAQMQVMRRSFSWRLTAPLRALAGRLGRTTTDRALGWRE